MANQLDESNEKYEQLRRWYLARLRRSQHSHELSQSLTPATLIKQDRAALETLIAGSVDSQSTSSASYLSKFQNYSTQHPSVFFAWCLVNIGLAGSFVVLIGSSTDLMSLSIKLVIIAISLCASGAVLYSMVQQHAKINAITRHEQSIADYALEAFWSLDDDLRITAVSPATARLWNYSAVELISTDAKSLLVSNSDEFARQFQKCKESNLVATIYAQIKRGDGQLADIEAVVEYSFSSSSYFCVLTDITAKKDIERYRNQIMQMLSHDLKSPLTSLQFSLALIAKGKYGELSEPGIKIARMSEHNVDKLVTLIDQLLDLQKSEAGQISLSQEVQPLLPLLEELVLSATPTAEEKQVSIEIVPFNALDVNVDAARLTQVFDNLLRNAIKYSPDGESVTIEVERLPGDFFVEVRFRDRGPGVPPEFQEKIFEQFFRVPYGAGNDKEGTGLGLAIAKAIIEAHGGRIGVKSMHGDGSCFWCHLPLGGNFGTSTFS